jgi:transposase
VRPFKRSEDANRPGRPTPDWFEVRREQKRGKHVTLQLLWLEYRQAHPDGWGYTQFCTHYKRWLGRRDVVMRLEYAASERLFVDFAGATVPVTDPETGEVWDAQLFVSVLGASGYLYAEATRSQDLASLARRPRAGVGVLRRRATRGRARQPQGGRDQSLLVRAGFERQLPGSGALVCGRRVAVEAGAPDR